jgi:hypothetical protein
MLQIELVAQYAVKMRPIDKHRGEAFRHPHGTEQPPIGIEDIPGVRTEIGGVEGIARRLRVRGRADSLGPQRAPGPSQKGRVRGISSPRTASPGAST